jgi:peptidyl-prolyl cis-trans isomerase C
MKNYIKSTLIMLLATLYLCSCTASSPNLKEEAAPTGEDSKLSREDQASPTGDDVAIATVNGQKILKSDLDAILEMYAGALGGSNGVDDELKKQMRKNMLDQMIDGEVLYQAGGKFPVEGLEEKVESEFNRVLKQYGTKEKFEEEVKKNKLTVEKIRENLKKNIVIQNYVDNEILAKIEIPEDDVKTHYESNKESYNTPEQVSASHILIKLEHGASQEQKDDAMVKIKKVKERLNAGDDFATVAKEMSEGPSAANGGDLGSFGKGAMVKPFQDAAFALNIDEVSDIVETQFGYHIIKVSDKKAAKKRTYEEVKAEIKNSIQIKKFQEQMVVIVKDLRAKAAIEIFEYK